MSKFIEEFYYGNIDPQARSTKQNKTVQKQMEVLMLNEDFLTEALTGENKKKFLDFVNTWSIVNGESNLDSFIMGFRLGANFTYDTFVSTETPFKDFLKTNRRVSATPCKAIITCLISHSPNRKISLLVYGDSDMQDI